MNIVVLRRRLLYISAIVLLLVPLYFLGRPSVRKQDGSVDNPGGTLAQIRENYDLGQGDLGEIDPASESMRLATLGLRGVASTILWQKAEYYKKEQFWDRLSATLQQIAVLQPHFVKVWEFQSHNLSYNVSSEFDDYRQRYQWVKRGMNYLIKGSKYNKNRTEMPYELGWFFGNKFGVADEKKQFRNLYRDDDNFHEEVLETSAMDLTQPSGLGPDRKPDNWLSGHLWYQRAYDMVADGAREAKSTMQFYRMSPQWLMKYSEGLQAEGVLDTPARLAWRRAEAGWKQFGERPIRTSFGDTIYLRQLAQANQDFAEIEAKFQDFCGETYDKMLAERMSELTEEQLAAWEKQDIERTFDEVLMAEDVGRKLSILPEVVAKATPPEIRLEAIALADQLRTARETIRHIEIYRNQINFSYWEARCVAEQTDEAILARTSMYDANQLLDKGELDAAIEKYEIAWTNWATLFNGHPGMMIDEAADEVLASIEDYRRLLDTDLPPDFELTDFMRFRQVYEEQLADPAMMSVIASWPTRFPDRNFLKEMLRKSIVGDRFDAEDQPSIDLELPDEGTAPGPQPTVAADRAEGESDSASESESNDDPNSGQGDAVGEESTDTDEAAAEDGDSAEDTPAASSTSEALPVVAPEDGSAPGPR